MLHTSVHIIIIKYLYSAKLTLCQHNPDPRDGNPIPFFGQAGRHSLPHGWLCSSQKRGTSSQILARRHTQKHAPVIWICDLCHKQIKNQQTSIRCNHTHNTHWVHLNFKQIKQGQYKPDRRCTIHAPTQIVTTTSSTDNTTTHRRQITIQPLTNNNQPKDKNIVILQININGTRNNITQPDIITIQETKLTQKAKSPKIRHMEGTHRHTLGSKHNTHTLWKTIHGLANKTPTQPQKTTQSLSKRRQSPHPHR